MRMGYDVNRQQPAIQKREQKQEVKVEKDSATSEYIDTVKNTQKKAISRVGFTVTKKLHDQMKTYSENTDLKINGIVKRSLNAWFNDTNKKVQISDEAHKNTANIKRFSVDIPSEMQNNLKVQAAQLKKTMSICVEDAITKYLKEHL